MARNPRYIARPVVVAGTPTVGGDFYYDQLNDVLSQSMPETGGVQWRQVFPPALAETRPETSAGTPSFAAVFEFAIPAGGGGAPDDVTLLAANAPFNLGVISAAFIVTGAVALSTAQVRSAAGGAGNAVTGPMDCAAVGKVLEGTGGGLTLAGTLVPSGGSLFLRRSDSAIGGTLFLTVRRI